MNRNARLGVHNLTGFSPGEVLSLPVGMFCAGVPVDQPLNEGRIRLLLGPLLVRDPDGGFALPIIIFNSAAPVSETTIREFVTALMKFPHPAVPELPACTRFIIGNEIGSHFWTDAALYPDYYMMAKAVIEEMVDFAIVSPAGIADGVLQGAARGDVQALPLFRLISDLVPKGNNMITVHHHSDPATADAWWPLLDGRIVQVTEAGYPEPNVVGAAGNVPMLESLQEAGAADYLRGMLKRPGCLHVCWTPLRDDGDLDRWDGVGLYRLDGARKPAWDALAQVAAESIQYTPWPVT